MPKFTFFKYNFYKTREQNIFAALSVRMGQLLEEAARLQIRKRLPVSSLFLCGLCDSYIACMRRMMAPTSLPKSSLSLR